MEKTDIFDKNTAETSLNNYKPIYQSERIYLEKMKNFLKENENFAYRSNLSGHFTGSAWIVNENFDKALLIHHVKLDKWMQPGGHIELGDNSFLAASLREAKEETGISDFHVISENIFDIDIHLIPEKNHEKEHFHYDVRYFLQAKNNNITIDTAEVHNAKWIAIDDLLNENTEESIRRMAEKTKNFANFVALLKQNE